jgi:nucleoid DNA-binding protein
MVTRERDNYFFNVLKSLNKPRLIDLVKQRLPKIKRSHISSVVNILFERLEEDLVKEKQIIIGNFLEFNLKTMPPKKARNYYTGEIITTKPFNKVKAILNKRFAKKLIKYLDVDSYLEEK